MDEEARVRIRDARQDELGMAGDLRIAAYVGGGHLPATSEYLATLRQLGTAGDGQVLVAVTGDGQLAGTVMLQQVPYAGQVVRAADEAEIRALAVAPDRQGTGIGRALLRAVIDRAADAGVRRLVLCTEPSMRTAHRLYAEAGFTRLPDRDWAPVAGVTLLAYGLDLGC